MSVLNYRLLTLEKFVAALPQNEDLLLIGQRQSGRTIAENVIQTLMSLTGDTSKLERFDFITDNNGENKAITHGYTKDYQTKLWYKGEEYTHPHYLPKGYTGTVKRAVQVSPVLLDVAPFGGLRIFVTSISFPVGTSYLLLTTLDTRGEEDITLLTAIKLSSVDPFGPPTIEDGSGEAVEIVRWLSGISTANPDGSQVANPYFLSEREYVDLLSESNTPIYLYKYAMARAMLKTDNQFSITHERQDGEIVTTFFNLNVL